MLSFGLDCVEKNIINFYFSDTLNSLVTQGLRKVSVQKSNTWGHALFFCIVAVLTQAVQAQDKDGIKLKTDFGNFFPELDLKTYHDDNLLRSADDELETWVNVISPRMTYELASLKNRFVADYHLKAGFHENSSIDDYVDNHIRIENEYTPTSRIYAALRGEYLDTHDARGTFRTENITGTAKEQEPDEWHNWGFEGNFAYGAKTARGRIEADIGYVDKDYDNNRADTYGWDLYYAYGLTRFLYRLRPKTNIVLEGRVTQFNYDDDVPGTGSLDSVDTTLLAGVTWDATFKTTGYAKIGLIDKNFDSSRREDNDDIAWEMAVEWRPKTYSTVTLKTSSGFLETHGVGDAISHDEIQLGWRHNWRSGISTNLAFVYAEDGFAPDPREDEVIQMKASVNYDMRRWLRLTAGYHYEETDSNTNLFDYDVNRIQLVVNISLDKPSSRPKGVNTPRRRTTTVSGK
jgi:hypothetical protein